MAVPPTRSRVTSQQMAACREVLALNNAASRNVEASELIFRVDDTKYRVGEFVRSSTKQCGSFHHRLLVFPKGREKEGLDVFLERVSPDGIAGQAHPCVAFDISVVNHRDEEQTITRVDVKCFGKNEDFGWRDIFRGLESSERKDYKNVKGEIVIRARVYSIDPEELVGILRLASCPAQHVAAGSEEREIKIEDVADFQKGEVVRPKPVWMNNHRIQVAAYPGGHPDHPHGQEGLAVYVHLLGSNGDVVPNESLKFKITVVNHRRFVDSVSWTGTVEFGGEGDDSWGPNRLLNIEDLRNNGMGWLDEKGTLILRVSAKPTDEGRDPLSFVETQERSTKRKIPDSEDSPRGSSKKVKSDN
ncbi:hypothetical protein FOZ60_007066 [Perkinsus olseni]|uniref:Uncharacterized protein n=1 Tax=Perkinsus olseni TaxID=32597 RepID=A0A7J6NMF2_PEROL|nr:hypothetical protein FOZ60_007066 [Perkinsus olseni]